MPELPPPLRSSPSSWRAAVLAAGLALAACAGGGEERKHAVTFVCPGGTKLLATFYADDDRMRLRVNGQEYDLPRQISASGFRYGEGEVVFWNKGREALLQRADGPSYVGCVTAPYP